MFVCNLNINFNTIFTPHGSFELPSVNHVIIPYTLSSLHSFVIDILCKNIASHRIVRRCVHISR